MIREAESRDVHYFIEAARQYLEESGEGKYLSFDHDAFRRNFFKIIETPTVIALVDDDYRGHILGSIIPSLWNPAETIARINTMWVVLEYRGAGLSRSLIHAFERRVPDVQLVLIDASEALTPEKVGRLYEIEGYSLKQKLYAKVLNGH